MRKSIILLLVSCACAHAGIRNVGVDQAAFSGVETKVDGVISGTQVLDGIWLDRKVESWDDVGLTYTSAVRLSSAVVVTNDGAWTGWTTTGSLTPSNTVFLLVGQYLQSPVQANGIATVEYSYSSHQNGTIPAMAIHTNGTIAAATPPWRNTNGVWRIEAASSMPGSTPGLNVGAVTLTGYNDVAEAATVKTVSSLKSIEQPVEASDLANKSYVDAMDASGRSYADAGIAAAAADDSKTLRGRSVVLGGQWTSSTLLAGQSWQVLSCGQFEGSGQLEGGTNYFAIGQNYYPMMEFTSENGGLHISSYAISQTSTSVTFTLNIATNNVVAAPFAEFTDNLVVGDWTRQQDYSTSSYPAAVGTNYVLAFTVQTTNSNGYVRAMQPIGESRATVKTDKLDGLKELVFENGARLVMTNATLMIIDAP